MTDTAAEKVRERKFVRITNGQANRAVNLKRQIRNLLLFGLSIALMFDTLGGRLLEEQAGYLFAWTEEVSAGGFHAGAYVNGEPVPDGQGKTITTAQDRPPHPGMIHILCSTLLFFARQETISFISADAR